MPRALLIAGKNALMYKSAIVTNPAAKIMKINMPSSLFLKSGINKSMRLLQKRTKIKLRPIVRAGFKEKVTASIGHKPIKRTSDGFFPQMPVVSAEK